MFNKIKNMSPYLWFTIMFIILIGLGSFNTSLQNLSNLATQETIIQTNRIDDVTQNISDVFAEQRFIAKNTRDIQLRMEADLDRITNATDTMRGYVDFLRANFNESMLAETYKEYAATQVMANNSEVIKNSTERILNLLNASS